MDERVLDEVMPHFIELKQAIRALSKLSGESGDDAAVATLWRGARLVLASAFAEHLRLLGHGVDRLEQELRDHDWLPWRELWVDGNDDSTTSDQKANDLAGPAARPPGPSLHLFTDANGNLFVGLPIAAEVLPVPVGETHE